VHLAGFYYKNTFLRD